MVSGKNREVFAKEVVSDINRCWQGGADGELPKGSSEGARRAQKSMS